MGFDDTPAPGQAPRTAPAAVTRFPVDGFDSRPASAAAYCNWPTREVMLADDALPKPVLTKAAQGRFENFQYQSFGHEISADRLPPNVQTLFATSVGNPSEASYYRIKVAGTPVYAALYDEATATYAVLADRNGTLLSNGCYPHAADGSLKPAFWQTPE